MARVDSLLSLVDRQGADELRLGTDREPEMFSAGKPMRLVIPKTSEETLRDLLAGILTPARDKDLVANGRVETTHEASGLGAFSVKITRRAAAPGFDVIFLRTGKASGAAANGPLAPEVRRGGVAPLEVDFAPIAPMSPAVSAPASPAAEGREASHRGGDAPSPAAPSLPPSSPPTAEATDAAARLAALLHAAHARCASDVHLVVGDAPIVRVDGALRALTDEAPVDDATIGALLDASARARVAAGAAVDVTTDFTSGAGRAHVFSAGGRLAASVRLLARHPLALADLRLPISLEALESPPRGLVVACGPAGSGKTTLLAALAQEAVNRRGGVLVTIEDPIEYRFLAASPHVVVRQREIGRDVASMAAGLREALREDAEIIFASTLRTAEEVDLALTAVAAGHSVYASFPGSGAATAVDGLVALFSPERERHVRAHLALALRAIVSPRLVRTVKGDGRVAALEVLRGTPAVAAAIREGKSAALGGLMRAGKSDGMVALEQSLAALVQRGAVAYEDARFATNDPVALGAHLASG